MAYYSALVGTIYHECKNCFAGNNIETVNLIKRQPRGARLCKICANLRSADKCVVGFPEGKPSLGRTGRRPKKKAPVIAYYSKLRPTVYHICKNCHVGNNLVEGNQLTGTPPIVREGKSLKLCEVCARLSNAGECIPGIPEFPRPQRGARVKTYYSKEHPEIFHICQNCFLGQNIEKKNLIKNKPPIVGKDKKARLCKICIKVCIAGKCKTGTPKPAT